MSKILKIIVNLVVLFSIIIAAALLVPPFAGVDTVMNDNTGTDTNLPVRKERQCKETGKEG